MRGVGDGLVGEIEAEGESREGGGAGELPGEKAAERWRREVTSRAEAEGSEGGIGDDEAGGEIRAGIVEGAEAEGACDDGEGLARASRLPCCMRRSHQVGRKVRMRARVTPATRPSRRV